MAWQLCGLCLVIALLPALHTSAAAPAASQPGGVWWFNTRVYPHLKDGHAGGTVGTFTCASGRPLACNNLNETTRVRLQDADLSGTLPAELARITTLEHLQLDSNHLVGTLPTELGRLTRLTFVQLSHNSLSGTLPTQVRQWTRLKVFKATNNDLTGTLPAWTTLTELSVAQNSLSGTLPSELGASGRLLVFNVNRNRFSGTLPTELAQSGGLQKLRVYGNFLCGPVPPFLDIGEVCQLVAKPNTGYTAATNEFDCPPPMGLNEKCDADSLPCVQGRGCVASTSTPSSSSSSSSSNFNDTTRSDDGGRGGHGDIPAAIVVVDDDSSTEPPANGASALSTPAIAATVAAMLLVFVLLARASFAVAACYAFRRRRIARAVVGSDVAVALASPHYAVVSPSRGATASYDGAPGPTYGGLPGQHEPHHYDDAPQHPAQHRHAQRVSSRRRPSTRTGYAAARATTSLDPLPVSRSASSRRRHSSRSHSRTPSHRRAPVRATT